MSNDGYVGFLTVEMFTRFEWAVHNSRRLVPWLRVAGYIRGGDSDELKHRSTDRPLGLPPTWLAAEEITNLLQEINQWPDLEDVAKKGHEFAIELTKQVETAQARWPFEDKPHRVRYMRCQACDQLTLRWLPPRNDGDRIIVKCSDRECAAVMDEHMFTLATALIESENERRRLGDRKSGGRAGGAVEADDLPVGA